MRSEVDRAGGGWAMVREWVGNEMGRRSDKWEFDVDRWRSDEAICLLRPAARDFWHEALTVMWKQGETGELTGSINDLQRLCRCSPAEARGAIDEIKARKVADVRECNGVVTLICRSMQRKFIERASVAYRVAKHRAAEAGKPFVFDDVTAYVMHLKRKCNADVTQTVSPLPPASFLPPITPLLSPPSDPSSVISGRGRGGGAGNGIAGGVGERLPDPFDAADPLDLAMRGLPPIPLELDLPAFRAVWRDWIVHRRERKPKLTPMAARKQFALLASLSKSGGIERAIEAVEHSIAGSYQGIFAPSARDREKNRNGDRNDFSRANAAAAGNINRPVADQPIAARPVAAVGRFQRSERELPDVSAG